MAFKSFSNQYYCCWWSGAYLAPGASVTITKTQSDYTKVTHQAKTKRCNDVTLTSRHFKSPTTRLFFKRFLRLINTKKTSKVRIINRLWGNPLVTREFSHQMNSDAENVPHDDVIMSSWHVDSFWPLTFCMSSWHMEACCRLTFTARWPQEIVKMFIFI